MSREETAKIIAVLTASYPSVYKNMPGSDLENIVNVWTAIFAEHPYYKVNEGLKRYMQTETSGFPPSPGQIMAKMPTVYEEQMYEIIKLQEQHRQRRLSGEVLHMREISDTSTSYAPRVHEGEG